jgi:hypothetical protein
MAIDPTVNRVLTMIMSLPMVEAGLLVTLRMMALIPMTILMIIQWPAA